MDKKAIETMAVAIGAPIFSIGVPMLDTMNQTVPTWHYIAAIVMVSVGGCGCLFAAILVFLEDPTPFQAFKLVHNSYIKALNKLIKKEGQNTINTQRYAELKDRASKFLNELSNASIDLKDGFSTYSLHGDDEPKWILDRLQYYQRTIRFRELEQPLPDLRDILFHKFKGYTWIGTKSER